MLGKEGYPIDFTALELPQPLAQRMKPLADALSQPVINVERVKRFMSEGISDEAHLIREYTWKVVLGYLPRERNKWQHSIEHH